MSEANVKVISEKLAAIYSSDSRRILATLIRLVGDFDIAEDALHEGFKAALEKWPTEGVPANPIAWLISAGRFKAIDSLRRVARLNSSQDAIAEQLDLPFAGESRLTHRIPPRTAAPVAQPRRPARASRPAPERRPDDGWAGS